MPLALMYLYTQETVITLFNHIHSLNKSCGGQNQKRNHRPPPPPSIKYIQETIEVEHQLYIINSGKNYTVHRSMIQEILGYKLAVKENYL